MSVNNIWFLLVIAVLAVVLRKMGFGKFAIRETPESIRRKKKVGQLFSHVFKHDEAKVRDRYRRMRIFLFQKARRRETEHHQVYAIRRGPLGIVYPNRTIH